MRDYTNGYVIKHGNVWRAVVNWQEGGRQRRLVKSTGVRCYEDKVDLKSGVTIKDNRGKALAETVLRQWRDDLVAAESESAAELPSDIPVGEYVRDYIESKEASGSVRAVTARGYRSHLHRLLGTELGEARMGDVTPALVAGWERDLFSDGLSASTVSHIHVFLKQVFERARRMGELTSNPFDLVDAPSRGRKPINALSPAGVARMGEALAAYGPSPLAVGAKIAVKTGMRQGEVCALRFLDVDLGARIIHVTHALTRVSGHFELGSPKTASSVRAIPFGDSLAGVLGERKERVAEERSSFGLGWDDGLYVIGSSLEGTWKSPQALGKEWHAFARVAGLVGSQGEAPRFHDLRHTFATIAVGSGVDVKTVSALLGHADPAMTLRVYADSLEDSKRAGMERLDGLL